MVNPSWIMAGSSVLGALNRGGSPAGPAISGANPVSSSLFDASGWSINFGSGTQTSYSSPKNTASPVVAQPDQVGMLGGSGGVDSTLLMAGAGVLLLVLLWK